MAIIDYSGPEGERFHDRHYEELHGMFNNQWLMKAWSAFTKHVYYHRIKSGTKVLEVGAGFGRNLLALQNFAEVSGIEPGVKGREHCESLGIPMRGTVEELTEQDRYDAIILRHVLEHVPEPRAFIEKLKSHLRPEGELIIVLPVEKPYAAPEKDDPNFHLYAWNRQTIHNLLVDLGCEVIESRIVWFNGRRLFLWLFRLLGIVPYLAVTNLLGRLRKKAEILIIAKDKKST